ncbi:DUF6370 family protein [Polaribacter tangerinus]|uniref:DUF6370 family protein n=1 Tax=Polaribacter tangerinus TaxID=1920034 RepID=UPI000B4BAC45|nr:DUF6370 family protein [Polaribacter tangerinus]
MLFKKIIIVCLLAFVACKKEAKITIASAEISCGQCNFELDSEAGCSLAVKVFDEAYFIDGFSIDDFGDAHDENTGFCNVIRKGSIEGTIENGRFLATKLKLIPLE